MPVKTTIAFLRNSLESAKIESHRSRVEIFFDRLKKSASEPTLSLMMEHLLAAMDADATLLHPAIVTRMIGVASSPAAPRVLRWLREQSRLCVMLAVERDREIVDQALAGLTLPDEAGQGIAATRQAYQIELRAICETPLAHGSDEKAGNAKLFRRISVLATNGAVLELPYY